MKTFRIHRSVRIVEWRKCKKIVRAKKINRKRHRVNNNKQPGRGVGREASKLGSIRPQSVPEKPRRDATCWPGHGRACRRKIKKRDVKPRRHVYAARGDSGSRTGARLRPFRSLDGGEGGEGDVARGATSLRKETARTCHNTTPQPSSRGGSAPKPGGPPETSKRAGADSDATTQQWKMVADVSEGGPTRGPGALRGPSGGARRRQRAAVGGRRRRGRNGGASKKGRSTWAGLAPRPPALSDRVAVTTIISNERRRVMPFQPCMFFFHNLTSNFYHFFFVSWNNSLNLAKNDNIFIPPPHVWSIIIRCVVWPFDRTHPICLTV